MSEQISNTGLFWLNMDKPTNQMISVGIVEFEEPVDIKTIRLEIEKRLLKFKIFRKRPLKKNNKKNEYKLVFDELFNIRYHVRRQALPEPNDKNQLQEMIGDIIIKPMDWTKPLWQVILIENYGNGCVVVFKMHHCMTDQIDSMKILFSLIDNSNEHIVINDQSDIYSITTFLPLGSVVKFSFDAVKSIKNISEKVGKTFINSMTNPFFMIELARTTTGVSIDLVRDLFKLLLIPPDSKTAFKGNPGVRKNLTWSEPIKYDDLSIITEAFDVSINVVLITILTGALKRYLKIEQSPVDYREIRVVLPVDTRAQGGKYEFGKRYGVVPFDLPVHVNNPIKRLLEVKRRIYDIENSPDFISCFRTLNAFGIPASKIANKIAFPLTNKITSIMTNIQGPRKPIHFIDKKIKNFMLWLPRPGNISLSTTIITYGNKFTLGIASDAKIIKDNSIIVDSFIKEFEALLNVARSENIRINLLKMHSKNQKKSKNIIQEEEINKKPIIDSLADEMKSLA